MATPDFLGFARAMPTQSPLERGLSSALSAYQGVTQAQTASQELAQKKMLTAAMPGALARQQQQEEANISKTKAEIGKTQAETEKENMMLKYLPQQMKNVLTSQQLSILNQQYTNQAAQLNDQELKENYVQGKLANIASLDQANPDMAKSEYDNLRKYAVDTLKLDQAALPETYDNKAAAMAHNALSQTAAAKELLEYREKVALQELQNRGKVEAAQAKAGATDEATKSFVHEEGIENSKNFSDISKASQNSNVVYNDTQYMLDAMTQHTGQFGYLTGRSMVLNETGQLQLKANQKLVLDIFNQMPHIGRGGNLLLDIITQSKPSEKMTPEAFKKMTLAYQAAAKLGMEYNNFASTMKSLGVQDRNQIQQAWQDFGNSLEILDAKGYPHPENINKDTWANYFKQHPENLPRSIKHILMARAVNEAPAQEAAKENMAYGNAPVISTGVIQPYTPYNSKSLSISDMFTGQ